MSSHESLRSAWGSTMSDDQARRFTLLRASTAKLLGYDDDDQLTAAQQIRLDRAITLRLMIDDLQARQMRAEVIDVKAFVSASEDLERMVGGNPETSTTGHDFTGARAELMALLDQRASAIERRMARDPDAARAEFEARLARAIEQHSSRDDNLSFTHPGSSDAPQSDEGVPQPPSAAPDAPATRSEPPLLIDPPPAPPPPPRRSLDEINAEPSNPPARPVEEWKRWVDENGIRTSRWSGGRY
jgi:hypothetical protein